MPKVQERAIYRLNEEQLIAGILPTPWFIGYAFGALLLFLLKQPSGLGSIVSLVIMVALLGLALVAVHRVSRTRIISHFVAWHDAGLGGLIGRDLNPLPHRYQELTDEEKGWYEQQRKLDLQRSTLVRREHRALQKEEALRTREKPGRRTA